MQLRRLPCFLFVILIFTTVTTAFAQTATCGVLIQQALDTVSETCSTLGRNQACYGNITLDVTPREGAAEFAFAERGDIANVSDIQTLRLSGWNEASDEWGIALMKLQANLPEAMPGQNVTFLLFGEVEIRNAVSPVDFNPDAPEVYVSANLDTPILDTPSPTGAQIGTLYFEVPGLVNGLSADGKWVRITSIKDGAFGWVSLADVTAGGDLSQVSVVDALLYTPMQAFYFSTGISDINCTEAPSDGILIQSPIDMGRISLRANEVDIQVASTIYLQAQPSGVMTVTVIEGQVDVTASGTTVTVPAGMQVTIPMDADLSPSGPPSATQPNDPEQIDLLPVDALMVIAEPTAIPTVEVTPPDPDRCDDLLYQVELERGFDGEGLDTSDIDGSDYDAFVARVLSRMQELQANGQDTPELMQELQRDIDDFSACFIF